jgi:hypothetical protein
MDTQSKIDKAKAVTAAQWSERAAEVRTMADGSNHLDVRAILEHIASLYEALARRPH